MQQPITWPETSTGPGEGEVLGDHLVTATPDTVRWGTLPIASDAPVLTVSAGESVTFDLVSHEGILPDQGQDPVAFFTANGRAAAEVLPDAIALAESLVKAPGTGSHIVVGPVAVTGVEPGDRVRLTVEQTAPRVRYGVVAMRAGRGSLPDRFPEGGAAVRSLLVEATEDIVPHGRLRGFDAVRFPVAPFPGIIGVASADVEHPSSVPPSSHGGNIDVRHLTQGASVSFEAAAPGGLFFLGDPHFSQGNGEVSLTAWEASLRVTVRVEVIKAAEVPSLYGSVREPVIETDEAIITLGLDADLDVAASQAVDNAVELLRARTAATAEQAYAYLSVAADLEISQVVDLVKGCHVVLPRKHFDAALAATVKPC